MYCFVREFPDSVSQVKRQRRSPPAPGTPAFEQLPAVSITSVVNFLYSFLYLFCCALSHSVRAPVLENESVSSTFDISAPRCVLLYIVLLPAFSFGLARAGLSSNVCAVMFVF